MRNSGVPNAVQLLTVAQLSERQPAFTQAALRKLIFEAKPRKSSKSVIAGNGLHVAIKRIGRRVLLDEAAFLGWVEAQQESSAPGLDLARELASHE